MVEIFKDTIPAALIFLVLTICLPLANTSAQPVESTPVAASKDEAENLHNINKAVPAKAYRGRLLGDEQSTRLWIDFDREVKFRSFYMDNPFRLVIDMEGVHFGFADTDMLKPRGLVTGLRYGTMSRERSRIVISLSGPAKIVQQQSLADGRGGIRFTLDLEKSELSHFLQEIENQRETIGRSGDVVTKGDRPLTVEKRTGRMKIVIDPGHGGIDGGAIGANGAQEKDITLAMARSLQHALQTTDTFDVVLTRNQDYFLSLKERVKIAVRQRADIFISIHADTLAQKNVRGATVYTVSKKASDEFSRKLAEAENRADLMAGLAVQKTEDEVVGILADLAARETKKFSVRFAKQIIDAFRNNIKLIKNPHRYAAFGVLKDPNVPSVLLELGYLSNQEDEKLLNSIEWRANLAKRLSVAVNNFFADRIQ